MQGYKQQRAFIIAQSPMQSTARDFWKMVYDRKCGVIVTLCELMEAGKVCIYEITCAICLTVSMCVAGGVLSILAQNWLSDIWRVCN